MDIKKKADALVRKHQTRNPFELILGLNVILVFAPLTGVRGFYQYFQRNNIIYIDENLPPHEQAFVCAHELGHMFLHKKANAIFMDTRTHFNTHRYELEIDRANGNYDPHRYDNLVSPTYRKSAEETKLFYSKMKERKDNAK